MKEKKKPKNRITLFVILVGLGAGAFLFYEHIWKETRGYTFKERLIDAKDKVVEAVKLPSAKESKKAEARKKARLKEKEKEEKLKYEYEVTPLINKAYFQKVRREFQKAQEFIDVAMFVISRDANPSNPVNVLLNELIKAKKRGVEVNVLLECPSKQEGKLFEKNHSVINFLKRNGINACFNTPGTQLHDKLIIIDDKTIVIGNHNWSKSALTLNEEVSVLIRCQPPNPQFRKSFDGIARIKKEETKEGKKEYLKELQEKLLERSKKLSS